jgi:hypothetical protein
MADDFDPVPGVITKQGRRPAPIDYPDALELPSLRTEVGREANLEMAKNPPATRDSDPWRIPVARPRKPSSAAKVNMRDPVPENGDPGLRAHMEGSGSRPEVRRPTGDDTSNALPGANYPLGRVVAPESHGRQMPRKEYDIDSDVEDDGIVTKLPDDPHQEVEDLAEWAGADSRDGGGRFMPRYLQTISGRGGPLIPETPEQRNERISGGGSE